MARAEGEGLAHSFLSNRMHQFGTLPEYVNCLYYTYIEQNIVHNKNHRNSRWFLLYDLSDFLFDDEDVFVAVPDVLDVVHRVFHDEHA